jgi:hypothetical protein
VLRLGFAGCHAFHCPVLRSWQLLCLGQPLSFAPLRLARLRRVNVYFLAVCFSLAMLHCATFSRCPIQPLPMLCGPALRPQLPGCHAFCAHRTSKPHRAKDHASPSLKHCRTHSSLMLYPAGFGRTRVGPPRIARKPLHCIALIAVNPHRTATFHN